MRISKPAYGWRPFFAWRPVFVGDAFYRDGYWVWLQWTERRSGFVWWIYREVEVDAK